MAVDGVLAAVGGLILLVVLLDVFFTVLFPASGHGPIRRPLAHGLWWGFSVVGRRLSTSTRRNFLAYSGPVQVAATIVAWVVSFVASWALVFAPMLGSQVVSASGPTDVGWESALYFSGYLFTTLGLGDVVPTTGLARLLTVAESAIGFATLTLTLTYFMSVYSALTKRKIGTSSLHHRTYGTGESVELLAGLARGESLPQADQHLSSVGQLLLQTLQTHQAYPVLRYFHPRQARYALPRVLFVALDVAALVRTGLDPVRYASLIASPAVHEVSTGAMELLEELSPARRSTRADPPDARLEQQWRRHHARAVERLRAAGLVTRDDPAGGEEYVLLRRRWDAALRRLARTMVFEWSDVEVRDGGDTRRPVR